MIFKSDGKGSELLPSKAYFYQMVIDAVDESIENFRKEQEKKKNNK